MPGKFLIDVTDTRLFIPANDVVIEFVRTANPFAHSDVGTVLLELGREIPGAQAYCPSYKSCAYVVLHTVEYRIFAIAFGQRGLAFRLSATALEEALRDSGERRRGSAPIGCSSLGGMRRAPPGRRNDCVAGVRRRSPRPSAPSARPTMNPAKLTGGRSARDLRSNKHQR